MSQDDVTQIRVGASNVGIIGLKAVQEDMAGGYGTKPDQEVQEELLSRLGKKNYIPESAKEGYGKAFLREFKRFLGKPFEEETMRGLEVKVLGLGCTQCDRLEKELMQIMSEIGIIADIEHVRDAVKIGRYGVMGTPALLINGEVKAVGSVPPRQKLIKWLKEAELKARSK